MDRTQIFIDYLKAEPFVIQLIWLTAVLLFVLLIGLIFYLKVLRAHLRKRELIVAKYEKNYELLLITYLYSESEGNELSSEQEAIIKKLKRGIIINFKRKVIVDSLLKLKNEISGEMADDILDLYARTKLKNYAISKLKNNKWDVVVRGVRELTLFEVKECENEIKKLVDHPKKEVRKEVQLYFIHLFNFEGLDFLNDLKTPLSEWDQIQLLEELQKFDNQQIPDIAPWLKSENDYVVIFALKLAKIYNQFGMKDLLLQLLEHKSEKLRLELMPVLSYLHITESKELLQQNFEDKSVDEQIAIFQLLEELGDSSDLDFIESNVNNENFEIKFKSLKLLKNINNDKFLELDLVSAEPTFLNLVNYVKNN
jgi:hypothetical protein